MLISILANSIIGAMHPVRVMLLAGSDLIHTMSEPGVWSAPDVRLLTRLPLPDCSSHFILL